jgi:hypothetical protein
MAEGVGVWEGTGDGEGVANGVTAGFEVAHPAATNESSIKWRTSFFIR